MPWPKGAQPVVPNTTPPPDTNGPQSWDEQHPIMSSVENFGKGALKGAAHTVYTVGDAMSKIPGAKYLGFTSDLTPEQQQKASDYVQNDLLKPKGTAQDIGYGTEQAAEFMVPGGAEEAGAEKLATLAPKLGKFARPAAKVLTSALSSAAVNKAQGGSATTGALMGAGGGVLSEGMKAVAPVVAESALGMRKIDRAFGRTPGRTILDETKGFRPDTVADSAKTRLGELNPQLEEAADRASIRPNNVRGLLPPPAEEIPLAGPHPFIPDTPGELIPAARLPQGNITGMGTDLSPVGVEGRVRGVPGRNVSELGSTAHTVPARLQREAYMTSGEFEPTDLPRSGPGVWLRHQELPEGEIPSMRPNPAGSLAPAREAVGSAMGRAQAENASKLYQQMEPMRDFLSNRFTTGEPIPENITARDMLNLKRGWGEDFVHNWNPEVSQPVRGLGRNVYGLLNDQFERLAPEAEDLNQRISTLIPISKRADSAALGAPVTQRILGRFGRHTGALASAAAGGTIGYNKGGAPGMAAGFLGGAALPEFLASPTGQMMLARGMNRPAFIRPLVGAAAQFTPRMSRDRDQEK